ncbi:hypothetical protein BRD07_01785 [Halobacteriales archaeon QS_9_68_42]|nr:MAG: hypothetical protein BRD07_01785 [Halobacteriales archaeon QS_9_68_42]
MDSDMPEGVRDVHEVRAIMWLFMSIFVQGSVLVFFLTVGLGIVMVPLSALDGTISFGSLPEPVLLILIFSATLTSSATGLTWLYFAYLKDPTSNWQWMYIRCQEVVYSAFDDPAAVEQWADAPLPDQIRRWLAVVALAAPVTVFAVTQLNTTFVTASFGLLLAISFAQLVRMAADTTSLRPLSQHIRYIFAGPFILGVAAIPMFLPIVILTRGAIPTIDVVSWSGLVTLIALYIAACVSGHCATLLYDSRKIDAGQQPSTATTDSAQPGERPSTTMGEEPSGTATDSGETAPTQVFIVLAGVLVVQAVGALIFLPFSPVIIAAAAIVQSVAIFGAARYIAPEAVRPRATLVGGGAAGGLGFLLGAEAVGRSTSLELLSDLSGGVAIVTIGFIAVYVVVAGVSGGPS